jgi:3'(2'), 5'-bisphosphate nucleotidase
VADLNKIAGTPVEDILALARKAGWDASDILLSYYYPDQANSQVNALDVQDKKDGPVTAADIAVNHHILDLLHFALGTEDFYYLSEETYKADPASERFHHPWVWIIDPLDGTRDFIERTGQFAVHIALVHEGRPVVAVVACPEAGKLYYAVQGGGTFVETRDASGKTQQRPIRVSDRDRIDELTLVASGSHRDARLVELLKRYPVQQQKTVGSVGCKIATILEHESDLYIGLSGKSAPKDWDIAAPELILSEAGGRWTRFDGTPLQYNQEDVAQWGGLLASNGHCHTELCEAAAKLIAEIDA